MSARHQLTDSQRTKLLAGHHHFRRRERVRYWLLTPEELRRRQARRREHNRLGFAVQLCLLRYPGWPLSPDGRPPQNLLAFVAEQLGADTAEIDEYAARDQTRREHLQMLCQEYRFRSYGSSPSLLLRHHLEAEALSTDSAFTLLEAALKWLRERRILWPALATLESLVRSVHSHSEREVYGRLFERLEKSHRTELDKFLELGPSRGSLLGWRRRVPRACSPAGILAPAVQQHNSQSLTTSEGIEHRAISGHPRARELTEVYRHLCS
jgi:hypothetical protein